MKNLKTNNRAYQYCIESINDPRCPKYVKLQMRDFINICEDKDEKFVLDESKIKIINTILKLIIMPKGFKSGSTLYDVSYSYQMLFWIATLCIVYRNNPNRRRYRTGILEICRKNGKTFTIAVEFILLFFLEPKFSKFFSVAPVGAQSREIKSAIEEIIQSSPAIGYNGSKPRFKIRRDDILFLSKSTQYMPLNYSNSCLDSRNPNVYIADEVGALPNVYAMEAMKSGQIANLNSMGCIVSTKYPKISNPMETQIAYAMRVLDKIVEDDSIFSLIYEPDDTKDWETSEIVLQQSNPAAIESSLIMENLLKMREEAILVPEKRENFVTKHCNIMYMGVGTETYIDIKDVQACRTDKLDWKGRDVFVGLDLSESVDNTSVTMVSADDSDNIISASFAFIPKDRIEEKTKEEKINYADLCKYPYVIACGDRVIDYSVVEKFILSLEDKYGVRIRAIGYDRRNAMSTAQKLATKYNVVEVRQHSSVLHAPTKLLKEKILSNQFAYERNPLYEINFQNSKCALDTNLNMYVHKKRSRGKVDMVVSTIIAMYLLQQDNIYGESSVYVAAV